MKQPPQRTAILIGATLATAVLRLHETNRKRNGNEAIHSKIEGKKPARPADEPEKVIVP